MHPYQLFRMILFVGLASGSLLRAQTTHEMDLATAIAYALEHGTAVKNATLDQYIAQSKVNEIRALGLPQINGQGDFQYFFDLPTFVLPGELNPVVDPNTGEVTPGPPTEAQFGFPYQASAGISASQLLFDGTFFLGLQAAKVYADLATKQANQTREETALKVTQAYYQALIAQQQGQLLDANITRVQELLKETKVLHEEGFVEQIDVDRLQLNLNTLLLEQQKVVRLVDLSLDLLKFQMGLPISDKLILTEEIAQLATEPYLNLENFQPELRSEVQLLAAQREFETYNLRSIKVGYYPSAYLIGSYTYNWQFNSFDNFENESAVFPTSLIGLRVNVPIFDGLQKQAQAEQVKFSLRKLDHQAEELRRAIDLEVNQASSDVYNAYNNLEAYEQNVALAQQVFDIASIKYKEGVGSSLEINDAETQLKTAQTQYLSGLLEYLLAKADFQKATGEFSLYHTSALSPEDN